MRPVWHRDGLLLIRPREDQTSSLPAGQLGQAGEREEGSAMKDEHECDEEEWGEIHKCCGSIHQGSLRFLADSGSALVLTHSDFIERDST